MLDCLCEAPKKTHLETIRWLTFVRQLSRSQMDLEHKQNAKNENTNVKEQLSAWTISND